MAAKILIQDCSLWVRTLGIACLINAKVKIKVTHVSASTKATVQDLSKTLILFKVPDITDSYLWCV